MGAPGGRDAGGEPLARRDRLVTCNLLLTPDDDKPPTSPLRLGRCPTDPHPVRPSPLEAALDRVGDRWSLLIVEALLEAPRRFNELGEALPGIAPNILTDRLRRLERERILTATPYQERPPRMSYSLTADGQELGIGAPAARRLGRRRRRRGRADPARAVRHGPRDPLVVPDLLGRRRGPRRSRDPERLAVHSAGMTPGEPHTDGRPALGARDAGPRPPGRARRPRASRRASRACRRARSPRSPRPRSRSTTSC